MKIEKDYRKWILFNNQIGDYQNLYELYTAVNSKQSKGGVSIQGSLDGVESFTVEQVGTAVSLELQDEPDRKRFLEYLVQHYLPNRDIEEWYKSKVELKDKSSNHVIHKEGSRRNGYAVAPADFKAHPKESKYYTIRIVISVCFYLAMLGLLISAFITSVAGGIMTVLIMAGIFSFLWIMKKIAHGLFIGILKGNSIRINEHQYHEVFKIVKEQTHTLGLKEIPEVYLSCGHFNSFVTKFARKKYLMLYSEVIETAMKGDLEVLKFIIGHELGHIKRRHLSETWLMPSMLIPFLTSAHSRACEYTCDRIGHHFSQQGSIEGILILVAGKEIHSKVNVNQYIEDSNAEGGFWVWMSEKFLSHPHTFKRMSAIKSYTQNGY